MEYEHMFVSDPRAPHIPFARAEAARQAGQLDWILANQKQITMSPAYEIEVYRLIAALDPTRDRQLLDAATEWLTGFAGRLLARLDEQSQAPSDRREVEG
jgi:hypothetical protein